MRTTVDGVYFEIGEPFDFSFLSAYGRVFKVFDDQDSGNICFGVENGKERLFIKFAGAVTARGGASPAESMARARRNTQIYRDLRHDDLLNLISCDEVGGGIALVFPWTDAICWGSIPTSISAALIWWLWNRRSCSSPIMKHWAPHGFCCGVMTHEQLPVA